MPSFIEVVDRLSNRFPGVSNITVLTPLKKECQKEYLSLVRTDEKKALEVSLRLFAQQCQTKIYSHTDYSLLAGDCYLEALKVRAAKSFSEATEILKPRLNAEYYEFCSQNYQKLDELCESIEERTRGYCSIRTLEKSYLATIETDSGETYEVETPNQMYLRVATFLFYPDLPQIQECFRDLVLGRYSCASPTITNAGMKECQLSSCFLMTVGDSLDEIIRSWGQIAYISSSGGGIGIDLSQLRVSNVGKSKRKPAEQVQWLKIIETILTAIHQPSRKGSATVYQKVWHSSIVEFIRSKDKESLEANRAIHLTYAVVVCDLFMKAVYNDDDWYLFCPRVCPSLKETWGEKFELEYARLVKEQKYVRVVKAREIMKEIIELWVKESMPFVMNIDAVNRKANLRPDEMIHNLNLCMEIAQISSTEEVSPCNLASISLCECVTPSGQYDFDMLESLAKKTVRIVNSLIQKTRYPEKVPEIKVSADKRRTMGIGVQGWANAFARMKIPIVLKDESGGYYLNPEAKKLNYQMFECIYKACAEESIEQALIRGPYETFAGSKASRGILQPDEWDLEFFSGKSINDPKKLPESRYGPEVWEEIREKTRKHGWANQFFVALMPTATTAHILNNNECSEPFSQVLYARTLISGQYVFVVEECLRALDEIGEWNTEVANSIYTSNGSLQNIRASNPENEKAVEDIKLLFTSAYEIPMSIQNELAADRNRFVCQSSSYNWFTDVPDKDLYYSTAMDAWARGFKTIMYYMKSRPPVDPIRYTGITVSKPVFDQEGFEVCESCTV